MESPRSDAASQSETTQDHPALTDGAPDSRWPTPVMVLLMILAVVWPLGGLVAGAVAYAVADRDQGVALCGVAAVALVLRWLFAG